MLIRTFFASLILLITPAFAGDDALTEDEARRFTQSLSAMTALANEMEKDGKLEAFENQAGPQNGEPFQPYSAPLGLMKTKYPAEYGKLNGIAKKHGFKNAEKWAAVGDRTMMAYMAHSMPPEAAAMSTAMTPEMLSMMPPEAKAQYETALATMKAVESVPQADRDAFAPVAKDFEAALEESGNELDSSFN